jgi:transcriptional regulator with XRE-family HTH domain
MPYIFYLRGEIVRRRLHDRGVPYRILAEQIGITRPYLTQIINGHKHLSAEMRWRLREAPVLDGLDDDDLWRRVPISETPAGQVKD